MLELVVLEILQPSLLPPSPLDTCLWMLQEAAGRKKCTWLVGLEVLMSPRHIGICLIGVWRWRVETEKEPNASLLSASS